MNILPYNYGQNVLPDDPTKPKQVGSPQYGATQPQQQPPSGSLLSGMLGGNQQPRTVAPSGTSGAQPAQPPQTFAQMQAAGQARPAQPPQSSGGMPSGFSLGSGQNWGNAYYNGQQLNGLVNDNSSPTGYSYSFVNGSIVPGATQGDFQNLYNAETQNYFTQNGQTPPPTSSLPAVNFNVGAPSTANYQPQAATTGVASRTPSGANADVSVNPMTLFSGSQGTPTGTTATGATGGTGDLLSTLTGGAGVNGAQSGAGSALNNATQAAVMKMLQNPSPYSSQDVKNLYNWEAGNIDDQFALQKQALGDQMARRGLGTSTINAGNLNNLNIGQRSAQETLGENLAQNYAQTLGNYQAQAAGLGNQVGMSNEANQRDWLNQLMGYGEQGFQNDLATNALNQNAQNNYQNYILSLLGMGYQGLG